MSTTALGIDLTDIDPNLLSQAQASTTAQFGDGGGATTGATLLNTEVVDTESDNEDDNTITTANLKTSDSNTTLLSQTSDQSSDTASDANLSDADSSLDIDVESVTPDFINSEEWQSTGFGEEFSSWTENEDGTWTQTLNIGSMDFFGGGQNNETTVNYKYDADGKFLGLADGTEVAKVETENQSDGSEDEDLDNTEDLDLDNTSTINTEPIELDDGNFAYAFDSDGNGEIDTYRITDSAGIELETISADEFTGTGYVSGSETQTGTVGADDASTDATYLSLVNSIKSGLEKDEDYLTGAWLTGSTDEDGDGIPDGILVTGLSADDISEHTFADGSKGFKYSIDIPGSFITSATTTSLYFNENGQLVGQDGKGYEGMELKTTVKTDGDSDSDSDNTTDLDSETYEAIKTTLNEILVDTGSDVTDDFISLYNEISGLFATGDDGVLTADDQQQLLAFFNTMIEQGTDTGVILSSKTMTDYFNLVKEYTGQYNGVISEADLDTFLADWLAESKLFVSGLDNSQKWSLDNITEHSQYEDLQNLIELVYGEGRTLTAEEAMRYLTDYSWKSETEGWLYGVGGEGIGDNELSVTNFLVQQMVLNARGTDQEYVTSFWLSNEDLDLEAYGLTVEMIAEAWGMTPEELKLNTAKAKKDKNKKKSTGTFFAPKDVVRIGDEDAGSSPQTITGRGGRSKTKPTTLLGGSVMTSTLTGSN